MQLNSVHDVLAPAGPQAAHIAALWHLTVWICSIVFAAILAALCYALWRAPRSDSSTVADIGKLHEAEPRARQSVMSAVVGSTLLLLALLVASVFTDRALARLSLDNALQIQITAHQWWWEVHYRDDDPTHLFATANEIHVPVGRPVMVTLNAEDVIHSFWVPSLAGKKDLIPGLTAQVAFRADREGVFGGQCAEFCGAQHAQMALPVIAQSLEDYASWEAVQRRPAAEPADPVAQRGLEVFRGSSCALCHAVQGTTANAQHGPDLTHLASRASLAAGALPNTPANLANWIIDPQHAKPGANMPPTPLTPPDLNALVSYLETLR